MKFRKIIILFVLFIISLNSCSENKWDVDLHGIEVELEIVNVDSLFNRTDYSNLNEINDQLVNALGDSYKTEVSNNIYHAFDTSAPYMLKKFYENDFIAALEEEKLSLINERIQQTKRFKSALNYLRYHFDDVHVPKHVVWMNNMFSGVLLSKDNIFVGLERYIDGELDVIKTVPSDQLHQWQKDAMNIDFLARDMMLPWIQVQLFKEKDEHLAYHIVQAGKVLTVLQAVFPDKKEAYVLRYSEDEWDWAVKNEEPFWNYLVKEQMLFENNMREKANFLNEAPYTVGLPEKGPDRLGQFLGFQMVKSYLKQNKGLSLQELLDTNFNDILQAYEI
jgi:hypothetical protein